MQRDNSGALSLSTALPTLSIPATSSAVLGGASGPCLDTALFGAPSSVLAAPLAALLPFVLTSHHGPPAVATRPEAQQEVPEEQHEGQPEARSSVPKFPPRASCGPRNCVRSSSMVDAPPGLMLVGGGATGNEARPRSAHRATADCSYGAGPALLPQASAAGLAGLSGPSPAGLRDLLLGLSVVPGMYVCLCVMEYCSMGSLETMCSRDAFAPGRRPGPPLEAERLMVKVAKDVAQGLAYLHASGFVHGDVKPANVLLQRDDATTAPMLTCHAPATASAPAAPTLLANALEANSSCSRPAALAPGGTAATRLSRQRNSELGQGCSGGSSKAVTGAGAGSACGSSRGFTAKLGDWGLTQLSQDIGSSSLGDGSSSNQGNNIGTVAYAAPECFDGRRGPAADMYSFGVVLWQMASGRRPFERLLVGQVVLGKCCGTLALQWPEGRHEPLAALCGRCMAHNPADRPTAEEVVAELASLECKMSSPDAAM